VTHSVQFHDTDSSGKPVHEYAVNGLRTPYVTGVLNDRGFCDYASCPEDFMEAARERGNIGHEVTHWFDIEYPGTLIKSETLDYAEIFEVNFLEEPLHPWANEQLRAWVDFRIEFGFIPTLIEKPLAWKINGMMVCGTLDRFGMSKLGPMVIDLKFTSKIERSVKYQLAAYAANPELHVKGKRPLRYAAHFKDGKVIPVPFTRSKDESIFSAALAITHDLWNGGGK